MTISKPIICVWGSLQLLLLGLCVHSLRQPRGLDVSEFRAVCRGQGEWYLAEATRIEDARNAALKKSDSIDLIRSMRYQAERYRIDGAKMLELASGDGHHLALHQMDNWDRVTRDDQQFWKSVFDEGRRLGIEVVHREE